MASVPLGRRPTIIVSTMPIITQLISASAETFTSQDYIEVSGGATTIGAVSCQVSGVRCQVSGVRCQLSGVSCQLSVVSCQLSVVSAGALTTDDQRLPT